MCGQQRGRQGHKIVTKILLHFYPPTAAKTFCVTIEGEKRDKTSCLFRLDFVCVEKRIEEAVNEFCFSRAELKAEFFKGNAPE